MTSLPLGYEPTINDVLCGRNKESHRHEGNRQFRAVVHEHLEEYILRPNRLVRSQQISIIVKTLREDRYFLKQKKEGSWYDIGELETRNK
jgi:hypothetical protein